MITFEEPNRTITNSNLEQAGVLTHLDVVCKELNLEFCTIDHMCDKTPAVARFQNINK